MSKIKKSVIMTDDEWKSIIYLLGAMLGEYGYANEIERQIKNKGNKEKRNESK